MVVSLSPNRLKTFAAGFAVIGLLESCSDPEASRAIQQTSPLDTNTSLTLDTEWRYNTNYSGIHLDKVSGQEFIYSGDPKTHLLVRVFDKTGAKLFDVPLTPAYDVLDHIHCLTMVSRDTIAMLDERGEKLILIDSTGKVILQQSLSEERCDEKGDEYELYPSNTGITHHGNNLYLGPALLGYCNGKPLYERGDSQESNERGYFAVSTGKCQLAQINLAKQQRNVRFGACRLLGHLTDTPRETIGMSSTALANGELFVFTQYSSAIYKIDTTTLSVVDSIPISYKLGPVGITPPPITLKDLEEGGAGIRSATQAYVLCVTYDGPSHRYLATVCHAVDPSTPEEERSWRRNWSLVVLDSAYHKVDEYVLSGKHYSGSVLLGMKNGTWVLQKDLDPQSFKKPKVFRRLRLS